MPINITSSILKVKTSNTDLVAVECTVVLEQNGTFTTQTPRLELVILGRL